MPAKKTKNAVTRPNKVMDVAHPGTLKTAAASTARPVIVTNRVVIQDPMVNASDDQSGDTPDIPPKEEAPAKTEKLVIKPLSDPVNTPEAAAETKEAKKEGLLNISIDMPSDDVEDASEAAGTAVDSEKSVIEKVESPPDEPADKDELLNVPAAEPEPLTTPEESSAKEPEDKASNTPKAAEAESETPGTPLPEGKNAKAETEAAADAKNQAELDKLIEDKEYFLPIKTAEHKRSRAVVAVGTVVIIVLVLAWINVALDAGIITIPGVQPLTQFFN